MISTSPTYGILTEFQETDANLQISSPVSPCLITNSSLTKNNDRKRKNHSQEMNIKADEVSTVFCGSY